VNIRIFNPGFAPFIALQMLIFNTVGLQIRPNGFIALQMLIFNTVGLQIRPNGNLGAGLGVTLGVGNPEENSPDNQ